jgi:TRAP-type mannitol/chloroaromatic compound transport system permease large subunit
VRINKNVFKPTNPEVAIFMMGIFLFAVLLGFPIAFTLMAMGIVLAITLITMQQ